jgi:hypothetical protein
MVFIFAALIFGFWGGAGSAKDSTVVFFFSRLWGRQRKKKSDIQEEAEKAIS